MTSPSARTLDHCRKKGWEAGVVERWIPRARRRIDLLGGIDIVALDGQPGCLGIQASTGGDASTHCTKLSAEPRLVTWLQHGNRLAVYAWRKLGARGKRKLWAVRVIKADLVDGAIRWTEEPSLPAEPG